MDYVCDAPDGKTWFRLETQAEADLETQLMNHAVDKYFRRERLKAESSYTPPPGRFIEQDIGRPAHVRRAMPLFLTLRDADGHGLATAMLAPGGQNDPEFQNIIVGPGNTDPYVEHDAAIAALGAHFGLALTRERCFPYRNG